MTPRLNPVEPLSQVSFIHEHLQLVFQDEVLSVYNLCCLVSHGCEICQGAPGFCDALVSLIGQRAMQVEPADRGVLTLSFTGGAALHVLDDELACRGPEAFQFAEASGLLVIAQNA